MLAWTAALVLQASPVTMWPTIPPPLSPPPAPIHVPLREAMRGNQGTGCFAPPIAQGARVVAVGTYEGGIPIDEPVMEDSHRTKAVVLQASERGAPLFLVLTAYAPVVWDLRRVPKSRLRAVYLSGYYDQAIVGAGDRPIRMTSYKGGPTACGSYHYAHEGGPNLEGLNAAVHKMLGRDIERFAGAYALRVVSVDEIPAATRSHPLVNNNAARSGSYAIGTGADGHIGVERLLAERAIRPVTSADIAALNAVLTRKSKTGWLAPVHAHIYSSEAFVVLKPMTVPSGMYGADSATFLIPRGVPFPKDTGSHNAYWSLATGDCRGALCRIGD